LGKKAKTVVVSLLSALLFLTNGIPAFAATENAKTAASTKILTYNVTTPFGSSDSAICSKVRQIVGNWGAYSGAYVANLPTARELYNNIPQNTITIIHGHGSPGEFSLDQPNTTYKEFLTLHPVTKSEDRSIYSYSSGQLSSNVLLLDNCCSGVASYDGTTRDKVLYDKGAKCVIGYRLLVYRSGEWGKYLIEYSDNGLTISAAAASATLFFKQQFPDGDSEYPTAPGNQAFFGDTSQKLKNP
jgi:hypothetical protein